MNYWDWDMCHDPICIDWDGERSKDANVYEECYPYIAEKVEQYRAEHWQTIIEALDYVSFMEGIWSVDFLFENGQVWLIDAAVGQRSAYWDVSKVKAALKD